MPAGDAALCTRFGAAPQTPTSRPRKIIVAGLGYFFLFVVTVGLLAANNAWLRLMSNDVAAQTRAVENAKKPAEITTVAIISADCAGCYNVNGLISNIGANQKVKLTNPSIIDARSTEGAALIKQYSLTRTPAFIVRGQTEKLLVNVPNLKSFGQIQNDVFVGSNVPAPYIDLTSEKIRGEFTATYLTDKSCPTCYDPTINRKILAQLGMKATTEKIVDRGDANGKQLIRQYAITTIPTVVLAGDLAAYNGFEQVWKGVGTVEADGAHIFRTGQSQMGTYYDLTAKKVVVPPPANTNTSKP